MNSRKYIGLVHCFCMIRSRTRQFSDSLLQQLFGLSLSKSRITNGDAGGWNGLEGCRRYAGHHL